MVTRLNYFSHNKALYSLLQETEDVLNFSVLNLIEIFSCCRAYTTIVTAEQRIKYKSEFNQYYDMYRKLHNVLDQVSKRFTSLESQLNHAPKGSEEFRVRF